MCVCVCVFVCMCTWVMSKTHTYIYIYMKWVKKWKRQSLSCVQLCNPRDCSPPDLPVHGILQARTLEWGIIPLSRGSNLGLLHCRQILQLYIYIYICMYVCICTRVCIYICIYICILDWRLVACAHFITWHGIICVYRGVVAWADACLLKCLHNIV